MKNKIKALIKNQYGMNLLSVIGTMAVLGLALVGTLNLTKMSNKGEDSSSRKVEAISLTSMIESRVKSVFLDTQGSNESLNSGICHLVRAVDPYAALTNVYLQLPHPVSQPLFPTNPIWSKQFAEFDEITAPANGCSLKSKYGKCYKFKSNNVSSFGLSSEILKKLDPVFEINIKPMLMNPSAQVTFGEINPDGIKKYDFKAVSFEYSIRTTFKSQADQANTSFGSRFIRSFIWAGDVGVCKISGRKISVSGSSLGDPDSNTVFNLPGFSTDSISRSEKAPLDLTFDKSQIRSGVYGVASDSQFLVSQDKDHPDTGPVYSACNEATFRCPQDSDQQSRQYQSMRHVIQAGYVTPNKLELGGTNVQIAPSIIFRTQNGTELKKEYSEYFIRREKTGVDSEGEAIFTSFTYSKDSDNWFYKFGQANNSKIPLFIDLAESQLLAVIQDPSSYAGSGNTSNNVCRQICTQKTNYNSSETDSVKTSFSYKTKIGNTPISTIEAFEENAGPVACTACYMKNCDQFGLGTFGAMHLQPKEPLDTGVPFCVQHESHVNNFYEQTQQSKVDLGPSSANRCISAKLNQQDESGLSWIAEDCNNVRPVMCFAFGKHLLAKEVVASVAPDYFKLTAPITSNFNGAGDVCFNLGRENIKREPLRTLLVQEGNLGGDEMELLDISGADQAITQDSRLDIVNFITQGSFFAPVGSNQEQMMRKFASTVNGEIVQLTSQNFWVGLKTDNLGYVYAPAPEISAAALAENVKWGLHYDGSGKLVVKKTSNSLNLSASASNDLIGKKAGILFHTARFKGVFFGPSSKPYGDKRLRVLCLEEKYPHKVFVSKSTTDSFKSAEYTCKSENALFLPPLTTARWEVAYQLVNPNDQKHAFPKDSGFDPSTFNPVWVNVVQSENGKSESMFLDNFLSGDLSKYLDENGNFWPPPKDDTSGEVKPEDFDQACFNKSKGEIIIKKKCDFSGVNLTKAEVEAAANEGNFYIRFMLKAAFSTRSDKNTKVKLYDE